MKTDTHNDPSPRSRHRLGCRPFAVRSSRSAASKPAPPLRGHGPEAVRPRRARIGVSAWSPYFLAGLALVGAGWIGPGSAWGQGTERSDAAPVRFTQARAGEGREVLRLMGKVVASRSTVVAGEVAGSVERMSVRPGARVRKGQELARLRRRPMELRLAAARGELEEARARTSSSELRLQRLRKLAGSEVVSTQNVDDALYELQAWEGRVARLEAEVERLKDDLERGVLKAPFDGTVVRETTQVGQWINVGDPVVELVSLDQLEVRLDVPESHFGSLKPGAKVVVTAESTQIEPVEGELRAVVPQASDRAHTFPAYVSLKPDSGLAIGMLVQGRLEIGNPRDGVWVPKDSILTQDQGHAVFTMLEDFSVARVEVHPGRSKGSWQQVTVLSGSLGIGDAVITHGNEDLRIGQQVRAVRQEYPVR